jgi:hypothetical protein
MSAEPGTRPAVLERASRKALTAVVAAALATGAAACGDDDEETTTTTPTTPTGMTGPTGEGGEGGAGGAGGKGGDEKAASAQREGSGTGLEENLSGADVSGTEPAKGGESTTGDTTP